MSTLILLALFSGIAVTSSIFMAVYFMFICKGERLALLLLAGLFISISLRIAKSIIYYLTAIPVIGIAFGYVGLWNIGACTWLYIKYTSKQKTKLNPWDYLHFAMGVIGFFIIWPYGARGAGALYHLTTLILAIYLIFSWRYFLKYKQVEQGLRRWNRIILIAVSCVWAALEYQMLTNDILEYAVGTGIASIIMYALLFYVLKNPRLFPKTNPSPNIDPSLVTKLREALEDQKFYQKEALTVSQLAEELKEPSYKISLALKQTYGKPFPELINHFRIKDVKDKLTNKNGDFVKIANLAYEVGFSTPSAFYAAFKKETGMTPKAYQKQYSNA